MTPPRVPPAPAHEPAVRVLLHVPHPPRGGLAGRSRPDPWRGTFTIPDMGESAHVMAGIGGALLAAGLLLRLPEWLTG